MGERKKSGGKTRPVKSAKARPVKSAKAGNKAKGGSKAREKKSDKVAGVVEISPSDTEIRRIESLEAMIDDLQATVIELTKSVREISKIGIGDVELSKILASSIEGEVTGQVSGRIIGWAKNMVDQVTPLTISVYYGGNKIASTIANKTMKEHLGVKNSQGRSFSVMLPRQFYDGKARKLQFKAGEIDAPLNNKLGANSFPDGFPLEGAVSSSEKGIIKGWGVDHSNPQLPIVILAMYGNEIVAKVVADMKETKLSKKLGKENCHHGFSLSLPKNLGDGKKRNIKLVISPWGYDLLGSSVECKFSN
jgi:hypothetical protein